MGNLLDSIAADQTRSDNVDIANAQHNLNWTSTFQSIPPSEVSRARVNYTDAIDRALTNKIALQARSDIGALKLQQKAAEHDEWVRQAPLREQLLRAHIDATGATERRKAEESKLTMQHTANLNRGMANFYANGGQPGTPEAQQTALGLIADNPMAHSDHILEIGKQNKLGNTPEEIVNRIVALKNAAVAAKEIKNPTIHSFGGEPVIVEGPDPVIKPTAEQKVNKTLSSLVGGSLSFGYLDDKGKLVPNTAGDAHQGQATHVSSFYPDPTTGKMVRTPPMSIGEFQKLQQQVQTPPPAVVAQTPDGTTAEVTQPYFEDPQDQAAYSWLQTNPDHPKADAVKARLGL